MCTEHSVMSIHIAVDGHINTDKLHRSQTEIDETKNIVSSNPSSPISDPVVGSWRSTNRVDCKGTSVSDPVDHTDQDQLAVTAARHS